MSVCVSRIGLGAWLEALYGLLTQRIGSISYSAAHKDALVTQTSSSAGVYAAGLMLKADRYGYFRYGFEARWCSRNRHCQYDEKKYDSL